MLAALDATKEQSIASRYEVRGYPTVKYFAYGEFKFDVNVRETQKIVEFMKDPKEPPPPPPPEKPWSEEPSEVVHLVEDTYKPFLKKKKHVLVMFYAPCKWIYIQCYYFKFSNVLVFLQGVDIVRKQNQNLRMQLKNLKMIQK